MLKRPSQLPEDLDQRYKCETCLGHPNYCQSCMWLTHRFVLTHSIAKWSKNDKTWIPSTLKAATKQTPVLGHCDGRPCGWFTEIPTRITLVHEHGTVKMDVRYCWCGTHKNHKEVYKQGIAVLFGVWPGTWTDASPRTLYTINALRYLDAHLTTAQTSMHDEWEVLKRLTDSATPQKQKSRVRELLESMRHYAFADSCLHHGVKPPAFNEKGEATEVLERNALATLCPLCPHPGKNMRPGWVTRNVIYKYLDEWFITLDGNFRQHTRMKAMDSKDFSLYRSAAYFVCNVGLNLHLQRVGKNDIEASDCHSFKATGYSGYTGQVSGLIAGVCRHGLFAGGSVLNLEKGERFAMVDYALMSAGKPFLGLKGWNVWYDVGCQFVKKLPGRLAAMMKYAGQMLSIGAVTVLPSIVVNIGDFHLRAHQQDCQTLYNGNLRSGTGRSYGENCEPGWGHLNPSSARAKEMGPGLRMDTLTRIIEIFNIAKINRMAKELVRLHKMAAARYKEDKSYLKKLEKSVRKKKPKLLKEWMAEEMQWLSEIVNPMLDKKTINNPFVMKVAEDLITSLSVFDYTKPSQFKARKRDYESFLIEAENAQRTYDLHITPIFKAACERLRSNAPQADTCYPMAEEESVAPAPVDTSSIKSGSVKRWIKEIEAVSVPLPSSYHSSIRSDPTMKAAVAVERRMREGQARDTLDEYRVLVASQVSWKLIATQKPATRKRTQDVHQKVPLTQRVLKEKEYFERYQKLLVRLGMSEDDQLQRSIDITPEDGEDWAIHQDQRKAGATHKTPSWIWGDVQWIFSIKNDVQRDYVLAKFKIHWFRCRASAARWHEEVYLRREEMYRMLAMLGYQMDTMERIADAADAAPKEDGREGEAVFYRR
ncbi:uncharacterized protein BXZ73DRAFT_56636 [Epithele typhae]|uniref:uncharacterized protein n=1 Tax=Epithele typhae TaxID=378194 RepID=UPI00200814B4|nr:uncharacterized protein BXZ73DRAFT_56636 [Epithele typhae]KAH9912048.1 hypothetical protein BXZ73DRAFT_56636 [Epithele typhae]